MPSYNKGGNNPRMMVPGFSTYLFGSWPTDVGPTRFLINNVALTTNVATVTGTVVEGNIPVVGALITITGTVTAAGAFNVTAVAITAVSITATTGAGTISFALTHADVASTADAGLGVVPQPETSEALANGASIPATLPFQTAKMSGNRTVTAVVTFPSLPTAAVVDLQGALRDVDSEYEKIGNVSTVSAGALTVGPVASFTLDMHPFYRFNVSGVSGGTNPTIVAKLQT